MTPYYRIISKCSLAAGYFGPNGRNCNWCGRPLAGRRSRWCSDSCAKTAHTNHYFRAGRRVVLRRDKYTCQECGEVGGRLEVNHIVPCKGTHNVPGCQHHLDNLITVCKDCHKGITAKQRKAGLLD